MESSMRSFKREGRAEKVQQVTPDVAGIYQGGDSSQSNVKVRMTG